MNTQTRLNQLMSFQENLKQKISNLPEGELCIYQSPSYQKWICSLPGKQKYLSKKNQPLAEALALKNTIPYCLPKPKKNSPCSIFI